jgi:4-amino-4-deoxy-L-arabinose transferase-like glycosyltransferase
MERHLGKIIFTVVIILASFLRFYKFPAVPPSLNWDEVSIGYNAYSVLKTGRDEFGTFFPKYFRSLDDYKPPVYIYLTSLSIALFGYNDFAVRFPSALSGVVLVCLVYLIVRELIILKDKKKTEIFPDPRNSSAPYLAAFIFSITPWAVQFSRMASEANVGAMFLFLGILLFLRSVRKSGWGIVFSLIAFALSSYSYQSYRLLAPLTGIILVEIYGKTLWKFPKKIIAVSGVVIILIISSMALDLFNPEVQARFQGTNVINWTKNAFGDTVFSRNEKEMAYDAKLNINLSRRLFHDSGIFPSAHLVLSGYFAHFSPEFLFFDTTQKWNHTPSMGLLYVFMIPLIILGIYCFIRKTGKPGRFFVFGFLFIIPLPSALTWDVPHPIRVFPASVIYAIFGAYGAAYLLEHFRKALFRINIALVVFLSVSLFSLYHYAHQYFIHLPAERAGRWQFGRKELALYLKDYGHGYDRIFISPELEWPYIFMLYYLKYDPDSYLQEGGTVSGGWAEKENHFANLYFKNFDIKDIKTGERILIAGQPDNVNHLGLMVKEIADPAGGSVIAVREIFGSAP